MFNYFENRKAYGKGAQSIKCVSFISATFVPNDFHSDKYLASYARMRAEKRVGLHVKNSLLLPDFN
jgi:hypothetical protein